MLTKIELFFRDLFKMSKYNPCISVLRVCSMMLIIITHFLSWKNINSFQIATIGVACFLFISGYLYGDKKIENKFRWMVLRIRRVLVPFWVVAFVLSIYLVIKGDYIFAVYQIVESLFNLQGLHAIVHVPIEIGKNHLSGMSHCWFLTVIMLCYLCLIFIKESTIERLCDEHSKKILLAVIVLHALLSFIDVTIGCFVIFFVGYFYRRLESEKKITVKFLSYTTIAMLIVVTSRIALKKKFDGECIYDFFIASFSSNVCAFWCFVVVKRLCERFNCFSLVTTKYGWKKLDYMTYPLFLTHYMFLKTPFDISAFISTHYVWVEIVFFVSLSLISAFVLDILVNKCIKL